MKTGSILKSFFIFVSGIFIGLLSLNCFGGSPPQGKKSKVAFWSLSFTAMDGTTVRLSDFKGRKVLIVNTASKCGFTPQYEGLEELSVKYAEKLVVIGFPANNFLSQEPGSNNDIQQFCRKNYGVTFPLSQKVSVLGDDQHPVFVWLTHESQNGWNDAAPKWNFYKYLINEEGELIKVFPSTVKPLSNELTSLL